jgi:hypothetical protein
MRSAVGELTLEAACCLTPTLVFGSLAILLAQRGVNLAAVRVADQSVQGYVVTAHALTALLVGDALTSASAA